MEDNGFKKSKLIKKIRSVGFSQIVKGMIRNEVHTPEKSEVDNKRILVVDDEADISDAIKEILQAVSENIDAVSQSKEALEKIEKNEYDLFVFDINMPGLNGIKLLEHLRQKNINTPVLFISGSSSEENLQDALNLQASAFIEKPFDAQELIDCAKRLVEVGHSLNQGSHKTKKAV